ncbi:MAG: phosphatidylethanolamine-binding protein [Omnitrophica bacterium RIFCSPLOWO2_12_FULL_44_17]|uniref:Phosphatidylethanolamine-binding protein n=1 Tax=Candidatus Danuiimicrobium aquiferis TaxID=1801832 RepID=A0A1G1KQC8_9BACT|nr:MAG: phosphatidylethanolamine-binding protein [Omnitrophica bacterium RIFCSPHIGHO2_02_FULL_45_28]OGW92454.1 MAG: phosphatidylethanolamine-binding protein [Omnitrophica bacterium RIFCSPHIGHO2_12_FULL_44_12]OGW95164.1 MAG: phosphatidylethanolamine-binding protein [Omnitrophica bacterium RIFCSPLOWO2_12_FULL_44_17]OGX01691.1 MAG: phosphatidylethanolamine-binding protein [Omnitrophica bacterium RIFCSPLOWO2_02_FULL_44_11]
MHKIIVTSPAFKDGEMMPEKYTCDGKNISPPLEWMDLPINTESIVIVADDPDAPMGTWVHWVLYDIPPSEVFIDEDVPPVGVLNNGATHGMTDFRTMGYGGPCPPSGVHRYFFKIYALDDFLHLPPGATKEQIEMEMEGHIVGYGELMGKYQKKR